MVLTNTTSMFINSRRGDISLQPHNPTRRVSKMEARYVLVVIRQLTSSRNWVVHTPTDDYPVRLASFSERMRDAGMGGCVGCPRKCRVACCPRECDKSALLSRISYKVNGHARISDVSSCWVFGCSISRIGNDQGQYRHYGAADCEQLLGTYHFQTVSRDAFDNEKV